MGRNIDTAGTLIPPVKFPVPAFTGIDAAFGASEKHYLTREQLGEWYGMYGANSNTPFHKAVEGLFCNGGRLSDYGLTFKDGIDKAAAGTAMRALMSSWAPKHEIKVGTVAVALANWCDYSPAKNAKETKVP